MKIRNRLRQLLDRDGKRPVDVWKPIGATRQQFGKWLRNDEQPSIGYVLRIYRVTGWTLEEMFEEE